MNRLTALETNSSLYARFVEDHTASVREMIRKLGEEVGRLEGLVSPRTWPRLYIELNWRS